MVVCPECGESGREGTGVCLNGHRFAPGTDERTEPRVAREGTSPAWGKLITAGTIAVVAIVALLVSTVSELTNSSSDSRPEAALQVYAQGLADGQAAGTLSAENVGQMREAARVRSGCGYVAEFVLGVPNAAPNPMGGGASDPLQSAEDYVVAEYRADVVVAVLSADESAVVIVAAWSCG